MIIQEIASIARFITDSRKELLTYFGAIPEGFAVPSVYFPTPEVVRKSDTLSSYGSEYTLFINFFAKTTGEAFEIAKSVYNDICCKRLLIPLINKDGSKCRQGIRLSGISISKADECAYQLQVTFVSRKACYVPDMTLVSKFFTEV